MSINLLLAAVISASTAAGPSYTPPAAMDGNYSTFYSSSATSGTFFNAAFAVKSSVYQVQAWAVPGYSDRVTNVAVQCDGSTVGYTNGNGTFNFPAAVACSQVELYSAGNALSFTEIQIYGTPITRSSLNIVFAGDSLTAGNGGSQPYTTYAAISLQQAGYDVKYVNLGIGGQTAATLLSNASTIDSHYDSARTNIAALEIGTNDPYFGATAAATYSTLQSLWSGRKSSGFKVIAFTITPRNNSGTPANFDQTRNTINDNIRSALPSLVDAVVDIGGSTPMGNPYFLTDPTYYNSDQVHYTDVGYNIMGSIFSSTVVNLQ
jgi:lysophospholipase L1-like esterase